MPYKEWEEQAELVPFEANLLQLKNLGIQDIDNFPFIEKPSDEIINETIESLQNLGALSNTTKITKLGSKMSKYTIHPRYSKLLLFNDIQPIFYKLCIIVSYLDSGFELKRNERTSKYFDNKNGDALVFLAMFHDFISSDNRKNFCKSLCISYESINNINKMASYLMKISENTDFTLDLTEANQLLICRNLYYAFSDQLAVKHGDLYINRNYEFVLSKDSIDTQAKYIVFDHIICGKSKEYAKNITVVLDEWI